MFYVVKHVVLPHSLTTVTTIHTFAAAAGPTILHEARQTGGALDTLGVAPRSAGTDGATWAAERGGAVALEDMAWIFRKGMISWSCGRSCGWENFGLDSPQVFQTSLDQRIENKRLL